MRRTSAPLAFLALGVTMTLLGCGSAIRVFLDLPERTRAATVTVDTVGLASLAVRETVFEPAAIEAVTDVDSALALLPRDHAGGIDWVVAKREGIVRPRANRYGPGTDNLDWFSYDFYVWDGDGPEAFFPHSTHSAWLTCETCHPSIYRYRQEARPEVNAHGQESCGRCHGAIAFRIQACERCHQQAELPSARHEPQRSSTIWFQRDSASIAESAVGVGAGSYPPAFFPHFGHRMRYLCKACHVEYFPLEATDTLLTMTDAHEPRKCGSCHNGTQAFGIDPDSCNRCHVDTPAGVAERDSIARLVDEPDETAKGRRSPVMKPSLPSGPPGRRGNGSLP